MKATIIIMPGSPAMFPELAPGDQVGHALLAQVRALLEEELADETRYVELIGSRADSGYTGHRGSLRAWGAPDLRAGAGHHLPEILQRLALGPGESRVRGVRGEVASISAGVTSLIALDGPTGLTPRAPSALVAGAAAADTWCRTLLAGTAPAQLTGPELVDASLREPGLWLELAALAARTPPASAELLAADTSLGVGRYVARWTIDMEEK